MVQGVLVKIDTSGAIIAQQQLTQETDKVFVSLGKQNVQIEAMEKRMSQLAATTQTTFGRRPSGIFAPEHLAQAKKATEEVDRAGSAANRTASFMQKLLGATGNQGAARGFGLVTSGARALMGSLNPVGIAIGFVSGALLELALSAGKADTAMEKATKQSHEFQKSFDFVLSVRERAERAIPDTLAAAASSAGKDPLQDRLDTLQRQAIDLKKLREEFARDFKLLADDARGAVPQRDTTLLGPQAINKLLGSLGRQDLVRSVGLAQTELETRGRTGFNFTEKLRGIGFVATEGGEVRLSAANAEKLITEELEKQKKELEAINQQMVGRNLGDLKLLNVKQQQDAAEERMGARERAANAAIRANQEKIGRPFEPAEEAVNQQTIDAARQLDQIHGFLTDSAKDLAVGIRELEQEQSRLAETEKRRVETIAQLDDETRVLLATTKEQSDAAKLQLEVNKSLRDLNLNRDSDQAKELEAAFRRNQQAKEYADTLKKVQETAGGIGEELGAAFFDAAMSAGAFTTNLKAMIQQLLILESKKLVAQVFGQALAAGATALFAGGGNEGAANAWMGKARMAHGGIQERAASGVFVDKWGVVNYGDRSIGVGEGGGAKPEVIMPLQRNQFGEMGIAVSGGMGGTTIVNLPHIQTANEIARARPTILQTVAQMDRMRGRYAGAVRGR